MNISKELLSEVLNVNVQTEIQEDDFCSDNTLIYWEFDGYHNDYKNINIYELGDTLKEWLESNCFHEVMIVENKVYLMEDIWGEGGAVTHKRFDKRKHWILNIIDACQWILDNKDSK